MFHAICADMYFIFVTPALNSRLASPGINTDEKKTEEAEVSSP